MIAGIVSFLRSKLLNFALIPMVKHFQNVKMAQTCLESLLNFWWVAEEFLYYKWQVNGSDLLNFVVTCSCIKAINAPGTQICYTLFLKRKQMFSFELKKYLVRKKHTLKRSFAFVFLVLDMYYVFYTTTWMYYSSSIFTCRKLNYLKWTIGVYSYYYCYTYLDIFIVLHTDSKDA